MRHETFNDNDLAAAGELSPESGTPIGILSDGNRFTLDIRRLKGRHTFIQGGTGSGKTSVTCTLAEAAGHQGVPFTILDPEGQFGPLAETFPHVIVIASEGTKVRLDVATIGAVATEAFRNRASFIVQTDDLPPVEQQKVAAEILKALMAMPREYHAKRLIVVDEVHIVAPERGKAESSAPLAEVAARGRKRGYSLILATQRFARVSKDCVSQCHNFFVGKNKTAVEVDRAAADIGLSKEQIAELPHLAPGTFFGAGDDISDGIIKIAFTKPVTRLAASSEEEFNSKRLVLAGDALEDSLRSAAEGRPSPIREDPRNAGREIPSAASGGRHHIPSGADVPLEIEILRLLADTRSGLARSAVSLLLRSEASSTSIERTITALHRRKLVAGQKRVSITRAGRSILHGHGGTARSLAERLGQLRASLEPDALRILDAIAAASQPLPLEEVARRAGFTPRSRKLRSSIDWLSRRGLLSKRRNLLAASAGYRALCGI